MADKLDLSYPSILDLFGNHLVAERTESSAFLGWFLEHFYRLDGTDAQDAICDGPDDKGIDGMYADHTLERIDVFQSKLSKNENRTLGDTALKEFVGTLEQLRTKDSIEQIAASTGNVELKELIRELDLPALIQKGYGLYGVFVTNANADANAKAYLRTRPDVQVYDGVGLQANWVPPGESAPVHSAVKFRLDGHTPITYTTPDARVFVAPLLASELIAMAGLQNGELFAWNVRQALGKTKVNKAIAESVLQQAEHKNFLLYHNGLTILAETVDLTDEFLSIDGYTVVNGCQSLTTLFEHRSKISDELRLLARIIRLPPQNELAAKITRHSNHQNSISARDLQSNSTIQRRLKTEFERDFGGNINYEIKRGEPSDPGAWTITNEEAARILLAFDLQQPWSCHQSYRLFDELHSEIFARPQVNAIRIAILWSLLDAVRRALPQMKNQLAASYGLMRYFLLYLLRQALEVEEEGRKFIANPEEFFYEVNLDRLVKSTERILSDLLVDLNAELAERLEGGTAFDYKRELKSPTAVRALARSVIPAYEKAIKRGRATSFSAEMEKNRTDAGREG